ncbi:MAG: tetrahydrofolate synthase [Crocinitomicaceae bacterium]|nr:tetrahydrofolate synthase [Crocinitomicaceae bacterium]
MDYQATLDYLFSQLPMYQRQGKAAYKADLNNTWKLMELLDHPYRGFKSIHVAGTNGKGSTSHMIASILQEAGYRVGLYTSPHLIDFRERIKINGEVIAKEDVINFVSTYRQEFEKINLSFFEWTVGLCFSYFAKQKVDIAIVEVGMGGRLDSTNVIEPLLSIITNIGLDHTQFLGNTLSLIAKEKAGIIKPSIPVIIGESTSETKAIFKDIANSNSAPITFVENQTFETIYESDLLGEYQLGNQKTGLTCVKQLNQLEFKIAPIDVSNGLNRVIKNTGLLGRWQILDKSPLTICDTAHNEDGLKAVLKQISKLKCNQKHIVLGMVNDKSIADVIQLFPKEAQYYFCNANIPRALPSSELMDVANRANLQGVDCGSVENAVSKAQQSAGTNDLIYIGGSTFVVADALIAWNK